MSNSVKHLDANKLLTDIASSMVKIHFHFFQSPKNRLIQMSYLKLPTHAGGELYKGPEQTGGEAKE